MDSFGKVRGRGAISNPAGRYEAQRCEAVHDSDWDGDDDRPPPSTHIHVDATRSILAHNDSPDIPFERSINPYRGCEHGCIYCYARPSHAYLGMSPGRDFETEIFTKPRAAELLRGALARPSYRPATIALGANTDPYQPLERRLRITRGIVEVLCEARHPLAIVTKNELVTRDIDLLAPMAERGLVQVLVSLTTLDAELARRMEPRASAPSRRLAAIQRLHEAAIPVGVLAAPMIPGLNDHELERIVVAACRAGAEMAGMILLRLPHELKQLFEEWLAVHVPTKSKKVLKLMREARGGKLYDSTYGTRMRGSGPYAEMLQARFERLRQRLDLANRRSLRADQFRRPRQPQDRQLSLNIE